MIYNENKQLNTNQEILIDDLNDINAIKRSNKVAYLTRNMNKVQSCTILGADPL